MSSWLFLVVLCCVVLCCLTLPCLALFFLALSFLVVSCLVVSCFVLSCLVFSCRVVSLSCPVLSCLVPALAFLSVYLLVCVRQIHQTGRYSYPSVHIEIEDILSKNSRKNDSNIDKGITYGLHQHNRTATETDNLLFPPTQHDGPIENGDVNIIQKVFCELFCFQYRTPLLYKTNLTNKH